ncbi:MAG: SprT family protein [Alkalibacterium sp.]|nr:SprT family protein [Alkalibacterium sp.]
MNQKDLQQLVEDTSLTYFNKPFRHQATFNTRLKTTGGRYHLGSHDLDFNPKVLEKLGLETLIGIIKHELCHYHLHLEGKGSQHRDRDFKNLLKEVGGLRFVPALTEQKKAVSLWKYKCRKCGSVAQRQRRFNTSKYVCAKCKGKFELLGREA